MTQKEKLHQASMLAMRVRSIAKSIEFDCKSYDSTWALGYARELTNMAEQFLKLY